MRRRDLLDALDVRPGDRLLVVANPATRRDSRRIVAALLAAAPDDVEIDVRISSRGGEARELAAAHAAGARMIVAVGGDGTVAEVATAAIDHDLPLAILPGGSTNIIARELHIPTDPEAGAALVFGPHLLKRIDAGASGRQIFLHMAGAGFDSRFFARSSPALKRKIGWLAYLPAAARTLFDEPAEVRVMVDGTEVRATSPLVLIANGRSVMHASMHLASDISKSDGILDVFIVTALSISQKAQVLASFARQRLDDSPYVIRMRGREVEVEADPALPVQFDGDVDAETPVTVRVLPGALRVVVPVPPDVRRPPVE